MLLTMARVIAAALLAASAATFAAGATIERHTAAGDSQLALHQAEAGTQAEHCAGAEPRAGRERTGIHAAGQNSEDLPGINPEATWLVVLAVTVSLLLAALILTVSSPLPAAGAGLAMLAFTTLDVREVTHQLHESRPGLAAFAAAVALLHLLAAAAALLATRNARGRRAGRSTA